MKTQGANALKPDEKFTLADWKSWPDDERWELIEGVAYAMSPAPRLNHQRIILDLGAQLAQQLKGKPCEPFIAPVDVFLKEESEAAEESTTVVQPDLLIVCDPTKCRETGIFGAPDWVLEVLSPSTSYKDQTEKRNLYEKFAIKEYWILNPDTLDLLVYLWADGRYGAPIGHNLAQAVSLQTLPGLQLAIDRPR